MAIPYGLTARYRLIEALGAGGMATVWRGFDEVLQRPVAVKIPTETPAVEQGEGRHEARREARAAARLVHPHIASVFDYGEGDYPYLVMELVSGETLSQRLADGPMPWREAVVIVAQVASALAEAHAHGVVHRDVKPANVMLTQGGAKLVDFGIAGLLGEGEQGSNVLGTPAYVAPERLIGATVDSAADVYALGVILYQALAGRRPWPAETVTELLSAHIGTAPDPLPDLPGLPDEVVEICLASLAKDPADRPASVELALVLAAAVGIAVPLPSAPKGRHSAATREEVSRTAELTALTVMTAMWPARRQRGVPIMASGAIVLVLAFAVSALAWGWDGRVRATHMAMPVAPLPVEEPLQCGVTYRVERAQAERFDAIVELTHVAGKAPADATLQFDFPGDQQVADAAEPMQSGHQVRVPLPSSALADWQTGETVTVRLPGTKGSYNPLPTLFFVNGTPCSAQVSGPPASSTGKEKKGRRDD